MAEPQILILGPPGAGKGTQADKIAAEYDIDHIDVGDILRYKKKLDISDADTEYDTPGGYMDAGELVPDEVVNTIVDEAITQADGFVLDGYPRTLNQAETLEGMTDLDIVLALDVGRDELFDRLTGRRVDPETGKTYHVESDMPENPEVRQRLIQRADDTEEAVRHRLDVFEENTAPVIEHYRNQDNFVAIDGEQPPNGVWEDVRTAIDERI